MKNKIVDIVCLCAVGVLFGGTALWNLIQPNRPTVSESEKRTLAAMPELTASSLTDGSYFAGVSAFISDTFVERERLVGLSRKMDTLKGFDYTLDGPRRGQFRPAESLRRSQARKRGGRRKG